MGREMRREEITDGHEETFVTELFYVLVVVVVKQLCTFGRTHQTVQFSSVTFVVCTYVPINPC